MWKEMPDTMPSSHPEVKIRKMVDADLEAVKEIDRLLLAEERVPSWPLSVEDQLAFYHPTLAFVAEVEGKIVGFLLGDIRRGGYGIGVSGWIDMIGVHPEYQRKEIGRKLVLALWSECQRKHVRTNVIVREDDERVIRFCTSIGLRRGKLIHLEM
jgi:ribosomal protein S18 acetylase RimI-like enzyme